MNSFKCQNMFIINPEVKVYVKNICLQKNLQIWNTHIKLQSWS